MFGGLLILWDCGVRLVRLVGMSFMFWCVCMLLLILLKWLLF